MAQKSVALFGGSFDPPHNGHLLSISHLLNSERIDEVWLIPSGDGRYDKKSVESAEHRWSLLKTVHEKVFQSNKRLKLVDIQLQPEFENSATISLVREIRVRGEGRPLFFVIGSDNIAGLPSWHEFEQLKEEVTFLIVPRLGEVNPVPIPSYVELLSAKPLASFSLSSSDLRGKLESGVNVAGYLPVELLEEIRQRKMYGAGNER